MKRLLSYTAAIAFMAGLMTCASVALADDDDSTRQIERQGRRVRIQRVAGSHWIGVHAVPVGEALKTHLKLEDRLIVQQVLPDSPAATGGLQRHDILLKFGDHDIKSLPDLLKAVADSKDSKTKVSVLRAGEEVTLDITPADRPENIDARIDNDLEIWKSLDGWLGESGVGRFRVVGPGIFEEVLEKLPENTSVDIEKENDEPARIIVKRDGDSWDITENDIDELPEDLRDLVRQQLKGQHRLKRLDLSLKPDAKGILRIDPRMFLPKEADGQLREQMKRTFEQLDELQRRMREDDPFRALHEDLESLRKEVEELRKQNAAPATESAEPRDV